MGLFKNDYIKWLITLTMITLSGFHCITKWNYLGKQKKLKTLVSIKNVQKTNSRLLHFLMWKAKGSVLLFFWQFLSWNFDTFVTSHSSRLFPFTFHRNENSNFSFDLIWRREKNEIWKLINNVPKYLSGGTKNWKAKNLIQLVVWNLRSC